MLFNSYEYLLFLPLVLLGYWYLCPGRRSQNLWLLLASYIFYGWWDWRFLLLILLTTLCSYLSGLLIARYPHRRPLQRHISAANILLNLGILGLFKYFNFFADSLVALLQPLGISLHPVTLHLILPVGISFYTFQALSYTIDVYRRQLAPTRDAVAFFTYIAFFPQLVAGPIERATSLLPQFLSPRQFSYGPAVDGMRQILWGFFKKTVIADNCALLVDPIFASYAQSDPLTLLTGAILFTFQIYGDFSGYSDIAIGTARLFGIRLMRNFHYPYFSRDIAEFWRRWHISLNTWLRDYIYIPLGGSRCGRALAVRNTFIIFLVSGLWHGASWTFVTWGLYHAILFLPLLLTGSNRRYLGPVADGRLLPSARETLQILTTFLLVVGGWIIFRAESLTQALGYFRGLCQFSQPLHWPLVGIAGWTLTLAIPLLLLVEWPQRQREHALQWTPDGPFRHRLLRWSVYITLSTLIFLLAGERANFIYFQF